MLTPRQKKILELVRDYISSHGYSPTLVEIGRLAGIQSKGTVHRHIKALVDKGYLIKEETGWRGLRMAVQASGSSVPLLGRIAAGRPIEAIPGEDALDLEEFLAGPDHYALRVVGDSMIDAGILDGDTVIVKYSDIAQEGEIVVALVDDQEVTLKRLKRRGDRKIELLAENSEIPPLVYPQSRVRIQGVVVAQIRSYR